ncbi:MAG: hypothetical protein MZV70_38115 [Desulfobacterales bacterium]|nr:hypothetical protein [Desulfobacterales bacterium]
MVVITFLLFSPVIRIVRFSNKRTIRRLTIQLLLVKFLSIKFIAQPDQISPFHRTTLVAGEANSPNGADVDRPGIS